MQIKSIKPIAELIKYRPTDEVVAAEWTGAKVAPKVEPKVEPKRPTFGKKVAR